MTFVSRFQPKTVSFLDLPTPCKLAAVWWMAHDNGWWWIHPLSVKPLKVSAVLAKQISIDRVYRGKFVITDKPDSGLNVKAMALKRVLPLFEKKYGKTKWGLASVPVQEFMDWMSDSTGGFGSYHRAYCDSNSLENHSKKNRWPLVIDPKAGSIYDGWHRFHTYVNQNARKVPCIWLVE